MKLMTKAIEAKARKFPMKSQDGKGGDAEVIVKFFYPYGSGTWLATEAEYTEEDGWIFFGAAEIGHGYEWGYFSLNELLTVRKFGKPAIERDMHFSGTIRSEWRDVA